MPATVATSRSLLVCSFVASIFIGDIWLWKITIPISILMLPALVVAYPPWDLLRLRDMPLGAAVLAIIPAIIILQLATGLSLQPKGDMAIWMPIIFAGAILLVLRNAVVSDAFVQRGIIWGALTTGIFMIGAAVILPSNAYLIPGQNAARVEIEFQAKKHAQIEQADRGADSFKKIEEMRTKREPLQTRESFAPKMDQETANFYNLKNRFKNLLGTSNYISVFLLFSAIVALFTRQYVASAALFALTFATLSRFSLGFSAVSIIAYMAIRRGYSLPLVTGIMVGCTIAGLISIAVFQQYLTWLPAIESLTSRFSYLYSGWNVFLNYPLFGAARSLIIDEQNFSITWSPHNSLLSIAIYYGSFGLSAYVVYVAVGLQSVWTAAKTSDLWRGVFVGLVVLILWGLVEIIVLSPAYEILVATLFTLARSKNREDRKCREAPT